MHSPGRLRFCNWLCHDGYREDRRYGLLTLPREFAAVGCCMYCGSYVATNAEQHEQAARGSAVAIQPPVGAPPVDSGGAPIKTEDLS